MHFNTPGSAARAKVVATALVVGLLGSAQALVASPRDHDGMLYLTPVYLNFAVATDATFAQQVALLRQRFPQGGPVRLGFATYLRISMDRWEITTEAEALANLTTSIANLDHIIARARAHNIAVALLLTTPLRAEVDPAQVASQAEDRRHMQWFSDNTLADGWWTYSRYARRQARVRDLYLRAFARVLANRIARFPETIVSVAGDGEAELAYQGEGPPYADYSPFAIAEFRDWLRGQGLYAPGQRYASDAFAGAARYRGDLSPAVDSNGDGATLNGDMGTSFLTWQLRYFDWSLGNDPENDLLAIPASVYTSVDWLPFPPGPLAGLDPPRAVNQGTAQWQQAWFTFRQMLVWRYTIDFARIMTTSADAGTGMTIPASRWSSYLIPADYLFGYSPTNPHPRYLTSASSARSTDIRPYGGAGITAFNGRSVTSTGDYYHETLSSVAPLMATLGTRWSVFEWNPSYPTTTDPYIYRKDAALIERYRPQVVAPYSWDDVGHPILGTGFEPTLRELISRLRSSPWNLRYVTENGRLRLTWAPPDLGPPPDSYVLEVGTTPNTVDLLVADIGGPSTIFEAGAPNGTYYVRVRARNGGTQSSASNQIQLRVDGGAPTAPTGLVAVTSGSTITFNWLGPVAGAQPSGYVIEAGTGPGLANIASLPVGSATTFAISGVPAGTYHVRVRAANGAATSGASNEVVVSTGAGAGHCTPVVPPGALNFRAIGSLITFEWDPPTHGAAPVGYRLEAGTAPGATDIAVLGLGPARTFSVGVPPGNFFLQLRAVGSCGTSAPGPGVRLAR